MAKDEEVKNQKVNVIKADSLDALSESLHAVKESGRTPIIVASLES